MEYRIENGELRLPIEEFNKLNDSWENLKNREIEFEKLKEALLTGDNIVVVREDCYGYDRDREITYYTKDTDREIEKRATLLVKDKLKGERAKLKEEISEFKVEKHEFKILQDKIYNKLSKMSIRDFRKIRKISQNEETDKLRKIEMVLRDTG